jgi:hypothetical protein
MRENFWPYGIAENEQTLNALFQYSDEQGLAKQRGADNGGRPPA